MNTLVYKKLFRLLCALYFVLCTGILALCTAKSHAQTTSLRTNESALVESGFVVSTSVLTDPKGLVYTEFGQDTYIVQRESKIRFEGEILSPSIITDPIYLKKPRGRMHEIVSFEIASDTLEDLAFIDRFDITPSKSRQRQASQQSGILERTKRVQAIIPLFQDYGYPALWEYTGENDDPWIRLGGTTDVTNEEDITLFLASLNGTGIYVVFDENPAPDRVDTFIPYEEIQKAPEAPYTSIQPAFDPPPTPESFSGDEVFLDPSFGNEVNIPVDQFGNPIEPGLIVEPISVTPNGPGAFGVPADQLGIDAQFDLQRIQPSSISPSQSSVDNVFLPKDTPNRTTDSIPSLLEEQNISSIPPRNSTSVSQERVDELLQQRLIQSDLDTLNAPLFDPVPENTNESFPDTSEPGSIQSALLNESIAKSAETLFEDEAYSSAPEENLPQTGRTKSNTLWYVVLIGLVGITGFALYRKKQPKQMELKIK